MRYLRCGSGPALLLVHGLLGYSFSWRFNLPVLGRHFTVYAPDLLGTGFSDRPKGLDCSMAALAERLFDLLRALGIRELDLVGTSHGGALATLMAANSQQSREMEIRKLVLVAPVNPWSEAGRRRVRVLSTATGRALFLGIAPWLGPTGPLWLRRMYGDPTRIPPGTLNGYRAPLRNPGAWEYALEVVRSWRNDLRHLESHYARIHLPTLLIWGDRDVVVQTSSARMVQRAIPGAELAIVRGAGHLPYEECPEEFNRILLRFLSRS